MVSYPAIAKKLLQRAKRQGADQADVFLEVGRQSSCRVRDGEIEDLTQSTAKGIGIRVFRQKRLGFAYSSDFDPSSLERFVDRAVELAKAAAANPLHGLPSPADLRGPAAEVGELFDPAVASLSPDWKIKSALELERAAKGFDPRITAMDSVGAGDHVIEVHYASSAGASGAFSGTYVYLYASPVASSDGQLQRSYWVDYKRFLGDLDAPEAVGKEAARRAVRMLGARKVKSQTVPVVFDPLMAASFAANIAGAANGDLVFKKASVLAPLKGKRIAPAMVSLVDDGALRRGLATAPFDGEGVPTRRTEILGEGVLKSFLYDAFTARKAKARTTANASRSYNSLPSIGTNNLYLAAGSTPPEAILRGVRSGLYVTAMLGRGADPVSGDYSRGANGLWIEDGELAYPVQEVTVAGNLLKMLSSIDAVGTDLQFRGTAGAPTLRFAELAVSGV